LKRVGRKFRFESHVGNSFRIYSNNPRIEQVPVAMPNGRRYYNRSRLPGQKWGS
jgi:hypothetical protein